MTNNLRILTILTLLAATASPSHAADAGGPNPGNRASVVCGYLLLLASHAIAARCDGPIDAEREARFQRMRDDYEKFIRQNSTSDVEQLFSKEREMTTPKEGAVCQPNDPPWQTFWEQNTTADGEMHLEEFLKTPRNPSLGYCL